MSIIGSKTSDKKAETSRANGQRTAVTRSGIPLSEEHKQRMREGQAERRARERTAREVASPAQTKRPRGRPKKETVDATLRVDLLNGEGERGEE
jgi:hypothetical protein